MTKQETIIKELYDKYELDKDDVFRHKHYVIITRAGIQKIEAKENIKIDFIPLGINKDYVYLKVNASIVTEDGSSVKSIITTGEATDDNVKQQPKYLCAMAEKRGRSRAVLMLTGLYKQGVFGEDEADDFKKSESKSDGPTAAVVYKGDGVDRPTGPGSKDG